MRELREIEPTIISDFHENVIEWAVKPAPGPPQPSPSLIAWCQRWNLNPPKILRGWAMRTLTQWKNDPALARSLDWRTVSYGTSLRDEPAPLLEYPTNDSLAAQDPIYPIAAHPELESRDTFMKRAENHWRAKLTRAQVAIGAHVPTPRIFARDFRWLALYLRGKNYSQISHGEGHSMKAETVKAGVIRASKLLELNLPAARRGRPRK
jgi:hypothetical protein